MIISGVELSGSGAQPTHYFLGSFGEQKSLKSVSKDITKSIRFYIRDSAYILSILDDTLHYTLIQILVKNS